MLHNFDPFIWQIQGNFGIRWYGMAYLMGFICAYWILHSNALKGKAQIPLRLISDFVTYAAIGILVGGRLGYVLFYSPDLLWQFKGTLPFWGVLAVNEGGMASHGGIIGLILACVFFSRAHRLNSLHLIDWVAFCGPIGIFFGRIANFINGELVGRPCDVSFPLGVKFPSDILLWPSQKMPELRALAQVVEKMGFSREAWLSLVEKSKTDYVSQNQLYDWLNKIITAIQDGNQAVSDTLAPLLVFRHPSQLYEAAGEGLLLFIILGLFWYRPRKPGVISSVAIMAYAVIRIVGEQFRMPDVQIGFNEFGLTRGQMLSGGMFFIGFFFFLIWSRSLGQSMGGWGRQYR